jgi:hypothetical protein
VSIVPRRNVGSQRGGETMVAKALCLRGPSAGVG